MRYVGQEHAVTVELPLEYFQRRDVEAVKKAFDDVHLQRYGTSAPKEAAQLVSVRASIVGVMQKPPQDKRASGSSRGAERALIRKKKVFFRDTGFIDTPVYQREQLESGNHIAGPALIEEHASTTIVSPGDEVIVDSFGNLDIAIGN
jgi:N-methylhydantoinase A